MLIPHLSWKKVDLLPNRIGFDLRYLSAWMFILRENILLRVLLSIVLAESFDPRRNDLSIILSS